MASSSSSPRTWRYRVFASFHGADVRKTFLSHLRKQFNDNGITMFDDQGIEKSQTIAPALTQAIRESRIAIVLLSKNYASSRWCLDELLEILKCRKAMGQIVMTVFYGVDPSDVRKQTREFGTAFSETCSRTTKEKRRAWSQALNDVGNIAGEHFQNWDNESKMIEKISRDISNKLNTTFSRDFEDMVGLDAHLEKIKYYLDLDNQDEAMIIGICGPAGIGKTTIARALHSLLSNSFQLSCFVENLRGSYNSGLDEYGLKLRLQEQLLSRILNQNGMRIYHLGAIQERFCDQKVLIILDDVNDLKQLEALANETSWFGPGSRIIVTAEDHEILERHGIQTTYHVGFPSRQDALEIFCTYAFRKICPPDAFKKLAERVIESFDNLPLGLRVVGSALRGKEEDEWEFLLDRLETNLDRDIEGALRVGYDNLHEDEQALFLHIAVFFNYKKDDELMAMLADSNLNVKRGLKILADKSLIYKSKDGEIVMHKLLQQVGRQAIQRQEPWKRRILIDAQEICYVLENDDTDNRAALGISLDTSGINNVLINERALKRMRNLRFLHVYKTRYVENDRVDIPEELEFPPQLRLLHWEAYPRNALPRTFHPEYLVELNLQDSHLEKLWQGTQPLTNLKKMNLTRSYRLKELPDLSNATNIENSVLCCCESLEEIPSSVSELQKLQRLSLSYCAKLEVVPTLINSESLDFFSMNGCSRLGSIPEMSTNVSKLIIDDTLVEEFPASLMRFTRLYTLHISGSGNFKTLTHVPECVKYLLLPWTAIEKIPDWIKDLPLLQVLHIGSCKLKSLPQLPVSLMALNAFDCESLESVSCTFPPKPSLGLHFINCFKLNQQTRGEIIQLTFGRRILPGREVPAEFSHQATGPFLTIPLDGGSPFSKSLRFKACFVISPRRSKKGPGYISLSCTLIDKNGVFVNKVYNHFFLTGPSRGLQSEHLCLFSVDRRGCFELDSEVSFEFSCAQSEVYEIVKCGVVIYSDDIDERDEGNYEDENVQRGDESAEEEGESEEEEVDQHSDSGFESEEEVDQQSDSGFESEEEEEVDKHTGDLISEKGSEEVNKHGGCWSWLCRK
ncbi:hypothetical protein Bca101_021463 [Brassica carinata]